MARIAPAAVASVCLALLGVSNGFVPTPSLSPAVPLTTSSLRSTAAAANDDVDDALSSASSSKAKANLDHEHSAAPTYHAKTTTSLAAYQSLHAESIKNPNKFWSDRAKELLTWYKPFNPHAAMSGGLDHGDVRFFAGGKLNVAYNAIDRHVDAGRGDDVAMVWEGDEPTDTKQITYAELQRKVSQIANALKSQGVEKGDVVTIYMPMIAELPMTMLACARLGAVHSVVFAGFSSLALAQRVSAAKSKFVVTADIGLRGTKRIPLKDIVDDSMTKLDCDEVVQKVMVYERFHDAESEEAPYEMRDRDVRMDPLVARQRPYSVPVVMDAEDELFILYTSGSTEQPKGLVHTSGGYALYSAFTTKTTFDLKRGDLFACVAGKCRVIIVMLCMYQISKECASRSRHCCKNKQSNLTTVMPMTISFIE